MPVFGFHASMSQISPRPSRTRPRTVPVRAVRSQCPALLHRPAAARALSISNRRRGRGRPPHLHAPEQCRLFTDYPAVRRGLLDHIDGARPGETSSRPHLTVHPSNPVPSAGPTPSRTGCRRIRRVFQNRPEREISAWRGGGQRAPQCRKLPAGRSRPPRSTSCSPNGRILFLALDGQMHKPARPSTRTSAPSSSGTQPSPEIHSRRGRAVRSHLKPGRAARFRRIVRRFYDGGPWLTVEVRPFARRLRPRSGSRK